MVSLSYELNASTCWLYAKRLAPKHCSNNAACILDGVNGIRCATLQLVISVHPQTLATSILAHHPLINITKTFNETH